MTAVSVWDHRPSPDELLEDRRARGWTATATATALGPRVLGYACRLAETTPSSAATSPDEALTRR